jgi:hypothetical protein
MGRNVTAMLMGDPETRKARYPTADERAWAERPQPRDPSPPPAVVKPRAKTGKPLAPETVRLCAAFNPHQGQVAALLALYRSDGLTTADLAKQAGCSVLTAKRYVCDIRFRGKIAVAFGEHVYRLTPESRIRVEQALSGHAEAA